MAPILLKSLHKPVAFIHRLIPGHIRWSLSVILVNSKLKMLSGRSTIMQARMNNAAMVVPEAMKALQALGAAVRNGGVPKATLGLVELRASQINGCSVCV